MCIAQKSEAIEFFIEGKMVEETEELKYLGALMNQKEEMQWEVTNRISKTTGLHGTIQGFL